MKTWEHGNVRLLRGDCYAMRKQWPLQSAILTDPPYGMDYSAETSTQTAITKHRPIVGDNQAFNPSPFMSFPDVMLWGCNNYCTLIPPHLGQWYVWDKVCKNGLGVRIGEAEFCWHKKATKSRIFRHLWAGGYRKSETGWRERSLHPNQKPIALLAWCLSFIKVQPIFDPFMGSGTAGLACLKAGRPYLGIEIDESHFETAVKRFERALREPEALV